MANTETVSRILALLPSENADTGFEALLRAADSTELTSQLASLERIAEKSKQIRSARTEDSGKEEKIKAIHHNRLEILQRMQHAMNAVLQTTEGEASVDFLRESSAVVGGKNAVELAKAVRAVQAKNMRNAVIRLLEASQISENYDGYIEKNFTVGEIKKSSQSTITIRLNRVGSRNSPRYVIVITKSTTRQPGRIVERIGFYSPADAAHGGCLDVNLRRVTYWLNFGAVLSPKAKLLIEESVKRDAKKIVENVG